ncbi:MAG: hypothetical protein QOJ57_1746 [Thermoleophilaceae bacterium]|jgi:hypothetical protein|nr:hypothetical protein [Thermoleophilaceae bacterium]
MKDVIEAVDAWVARGDQSGGRLPKASGRIHQVGA